MASPFLSQIVGLFCYSSVEGAYLVIQDQDVNTPCKTPSDAKQKPLKEKVGKVWAGNNSAIHVNSPEASADKLYENTKVNEYDDSDDWLGVPGSYFRNHPDNFDRWVSLPQHGEPPRG